MRGKQQQEVHCASASLTNERVENRRHGQSRHADQIERRGIDRRFGHFDMPGAASGEGDVNTGSVSPRFRASVPDNHSLVVQLADAPSS